MRPSDIAVLLTKAAAYDRRTVGEADVAAWHEVLADLDLADALSAVARHYRDNAQWIMPSHIRAIVGEIERERRRVTRELQHAAPIENHPDDCDGWLRALGAIDRCPACRPKAIEPAITRPAGAHP